LLEVTDQLITYTQYSFPVLSYSHVHSFLWGAALLKSEREVYCYSTLQSNYQPKRPRVELLTYRIEPYEPSTWLHASTHTIVSLHHPPFQLQAKET